MGRGWGQVESEDAEEGGRRPAAGAGAQAPGALVPAASTQAGFLVSATAARKEGETGADSRRDAVARWRGNQGNRGRDGEVLGGSGEPSRVVDWWSGAPPHVAVPGMSGGEMRYGRRKRVGPAGQISVELYCKTKEKKRKK